MSVVLGVTVSVPLVAEVSVPVAEVSVPVAEGVSVKVVLRSVVRETGPGGVWRVVVSEL